ncbi:Helix-turn-helix domain-containing protein [Streptomyces sp. 1222.5]|uniref:helix-turn-helix domain-containing protein n=1 Tax=unclassified Streptomyces TaxID=2593676 RepID=UPI0008981024|nr:MULTISPECIES: helix-turn-helix transcriptional regulator [unclassified Streptomyces]PKW04952.1 helix-turn-helix protein [Streptomyces sp. 5112.2]SEB52339.1 Helix-turn-helix domain-containing protein [Streptomyces sp. 1222.5]
MAGRPLSPIPTSTPPALRTLVQRLRNAKEASGKTLEALAKDSGVSESVVRRALAGKGVPYWESVKAITLACGGNEDDMARAWCAAKAEEVLPGTRDLGPKMVTSRAQLVEAMISMRIEGGYPPLHQLQKRAGIDENGRTRLPHSTLHQVLKGQIPPTETLFTAFMDALSTPAAERRNWLDAHRRIFADAPARRAWGQPPPVVRDEPPAINSCEAAERALPRLARNEEIKRKIGQLKEPDDYELLGLGYPNSPEPDDFPWPDEEELAAWEAEAAAQPPAQERVDLREKLRAIIDRTEPARRVGPPPRASRPQHGGSF